LLVGLVTFVAHHSWTTLAVVGALVVLSIYLSCTQLMFLTQRDDLLSPQKDYLKRWQTFVAEFGDDDDMVVVVEGEDRQHMQQALETLAGRLEQNPRLFDRVFYKVDLRDLRKRALLFLPTDQIKAIQENVLSMDKLLETPVIGDVDPMFSWKSLTLAQLLGEAKRRGVNVRKDGMQPADAQVLDQLQSICEMAATVVESPNSYQSPWKSIVPETPRQKDLLAEPQFFFSCDGKLAFLLARATRDMTSFQSTQGSIDEMRRLLDVMQREHPQLKIGLTGLPVLENDEMAASQRDTNLAFLLALAGVSLLFFIVYRRVRYPILTVTTLLTGTVLAMGWLTLTVGHLNILSSTFAVMLIGIGDYGVLWIIRYDRERAAGLDTLEAMRVTTRHVGPGILIAALTTALAFFAAVLVDFRAMKELGWIAGSGILFCALSCFTVLPALVRLTDRRATAENRDLLPLAPRLSSLNPQSVAWLPWVTRHPRLVLGVSAALTLFFGYFALQLHYDHNLLHLQAHGLDSVQWETKLINKTAGASWHAVSWADSPEAALELKAEYEKLPAVERVVEVASLVPPDQKAKVGMLKDIHHRLRHLPQRGVPIPHARPSADRLQGQVERMAAQLEPLARGKAAAVIAPLCRSLRRLQDALQRTDAEVAAQRLQRFETLLTKDLAENLHRLRDVSTPGFISLADMPPSLRERYVGVSGKWLIRIFGKGSLWEYEPLETFVEQIQSVDDPNVAGKPISTLDGLRLMQQGFQWSCIYAFVAMLVVLLIDFRHPGHVLLTFLPLGVGLIASLGILGMLGLPLNPANMIGLPLILGVGCDNGVHVLHNFLSRRRQQPYALSRATGRGICVKALTTVLGFGALIISQQWGLASLGLLLAIGISCCMVTALVILPATLSWLTARQTTEPLQTLPVEPAAARAA
jgi:hopanoid biosynthesis associated RND transporter like protein HpnN